MSNGESFNVRFKAMKKELGYTNKDISKMTGSTVDSINTVTQPNKELPRWLKFAILSFEDYSNTKK